MMYLTLQSLMEYIRKIYNEMSMENIKLKDRTNLLILKKSSFYYSFLDIKINVFQGLFIIWDYHVFVGNKI